MTVAPVSRPWARWLHPGEVAALEAKHKHCDARKCRNPVATTTWRYWRSSELGGQVLLTEHFVCREHGGSFAALHRIPVDPAGEVGARRLSGEETAAAGAEGRHCDWPACVNAATWVFAQSFTVRGEPRADQDLSCDPHARMFADRLHISIAPAPDEGGSR